ncbi:MAG TPA: DUF951 domain-containing protein [Aggregatilineales bacterium]|nr:DUF951 domain-containing protein [Anaerolineales bacterium]HRE49569.1 DUF951 domain-containing protein [Aggregatilineales bacterium]
MPTKTPLQIQIGDTIQMRKVHPCGSDRWTIYRVGADVGIKCAGCGRRVMLTRREFDKAAKAKLPPAPESDEG